MACVVDDVNDPRLAGFRDVKRWRSPAILVEGLEAVRMLLKSPYCCTELLVQSHMLADLEGFLGEQVLVCSLAVMEEATGVSVPSKAASLCFARAARLPPSLPSGDLRRVVVLDGLTDATNVGSIATAQGKSKPNMRVARALGATALLLSRDCCDALAPLAVRASQGQIFHLPFFQGDLVPLLKELREEGVLTLAAVVQEGAKYLDEVKALPERWALVLGSEHFGVSLEVREVCCGMLKVRMAPGVDSFNVVTSAGVLIHGCVEREGRSSETTW
ncbi:unnamed protein product [Effrenium voratum]|nr:unnamed protein product [Effrenium voratum]